MVKYTYEVVLTSQAEQVNAKADIEPVTPFGRNMMKESKTLNIIPNDLQLVAL